MVAVLTGSQLKRAKPLRYGPCCFRKRQQEKQVQTKAEPEFYLGQLHVSDQQVNINNYFTGASLLN